MGNNINSMPLVFRIARVVRVATGRLLFKKRLPARFGAARIYVTPRSDIRLLKPGWKDSAGDLLLVAGRYIRNGFCVWDIGSNLGIFSFCAAFKSGSGGQCYSLEADPKYAELQNRTVSRLPGGYARVTVLCAAIAGEIALLELAIPKKGHARNHLAIVSGNSAGEIESTKQVVSITGDFLAKHWKKPDFVKMDVEGAELLALEGAPWLLEEARPVFYIEVCEETQKQVSALFRRSNYRMFRLAADGTEQAVESCVFNTLAKPVEKC